MTSSVMTAAVFTLRRTMTGVVFLVLVLTFCGVNSLDNGLALTPPMGWLSWERFECQTDCTFDPQTCISENLYMDMADRMAADGYREAGYQYVNIDDCWSNMERDSDGRLSGDSKRFPSGMKKLGDYIHSKGLKFGIYGDFGTKTCGGYPGSIFDMQLDADTFAEWGVDSLKLDGCNTASQLYDAGYERMGFYLNRTGRPILYSCSWPDYLKIKRDPNYELVAGYCNLWRVYNDIYDSWDSILSIINYFAADKYNFTRVAGPGHWNDPDMLLVGDFGLSLVEQRTQFGMWAIMAAPLYMSNDLRRISNESRDILLNKNVIAINQDPLGIQGRRIAVDGPIQIWTRPLAPDGKSLAFALLNTRSDGSQQKVIFNMKSLNATLSAGYKVTEAFSGQTMGNYLPTTPLTVFVDPNGIFLGIARPL